MKDKIKEIERNLILSSKQGGITIEEATDQLLQLHIQGEKQFLDKIIKLIDEGNDAESIIRSQAESGIYRGVEGLPLQGEQPKE